MCLPIEEQEDGGNLIDERTIEDRGPIDRIRGRGNFRRGVSTLRLEEGENGRRIGRIIMPDGSRHEVLGEVHEGLDELPGWGRAAPTAHQNDNQSK